ncbi:MAG: sulfotransferase family protein [Acidimicrobiales bacterium]
MTGAPAPDPAGGRTIEGGGMPASRVPARSGIMVLGMHRSGTSAITLGLAELGAPLGTPQTAMPPSASNTAGYWEQLPLMFVNDTLLAHLGASWQDPPEPGVDLLGALEPQSAMAVDSFREVFPGRHWLWKDPRTCLLAPFWAHALGDEHVVVVVFRHPHEVARSLRRAEGVEEARGRHLWSAYTRSALSYAAGRPSFLVCYEDALADADAFGLVASRLFGLAGMRAAPGGRERIRGALDAGLRHQVAPDPEGSRGDEDLALFAELRHHQGLYEEGLGPELAGLATGVAP